MGTFQDKITANKPQTIKGVTRGYAEHLSQYAIERNPNIKDFGDFKQALFQEFGTTPQGQGALNFLTEDEIVALFKQPNVRRIIEENAGKEKADEIYKIAERTDIVAIREVPVGKKITTRQFKVHISPKRVAVSSHIRKGRTIKAYSRGNVRWSSEQIKFIRTQKLRKVPSRKIALEYNKKFKEQRRSMSSVRTKLYRI